MTNHRAPHRRSAMHRPPRPWCRWHCWEWLRYLERAFPQSRGGDDDFFGVGFLCKGGVTDEHRRNGEAQ